MVLTASLAVSYTHLDVYKRQALSRSGFDGYLIDDHVGDMRGDDPCHRRAHAREIGYMQGLVCMADYLLENGKKA